jgi:hypothetical protein
MLADWVVAVAHGGESQQVAFGVCARRDHEPKSGQFRQRPAVPVHEVIVQAAKVVSMFPVIANYYVLLPAFVQDELSRWGNFGSRPRLDDIIESSTKR